MANRILRDYTNSEKIDSLSTKAEVLFIRLMTQADDFGSFFAHPKLINANCFPLKNYSLKDVQIMINELIKAGIIFIYQVDGKKYLRIVDFRQRLQNMKNKFPEPSKEQVFIENNSNSPEFTVNHGESLLETKRSRNESEVETETEVEGEILASPKSKVIKHPFRHSEFFDKEKFFAALENSSPPYCNANPNHYYDAALNGSDSKGYKYINWLAAIKTWISNDIAKNQFKTKFSQPIPITNESASKNRYPTRSEQVTTTNLDQLRRISEGSL